MGNFLLWIILLISVNVIWSIQLYNIRLQKEKSIQQMNIQIRNDIGKRLEGSSYEGYHKKQPGVYQSWLTNDILTINSLGFETLALMVSQILNIVFSVIILLSYHYSLLITVSFFIVLMLSVPKFFKTILNKKAVNMTKTNEELSNRIMNILKGFDDFFSQNRQEQIPVAILDVSEKLSLAKVEYARTSGKMSGLANGVSLVSQIIILAHAAFLYAAHIVPFGVVSTAQYFASNIFAGLTGFTANLGELRSVDPIFKKFEQLDEIQEAFAGKQVEALQNNLVFDNVSYQYVKGQLVLNHVSLCFEKGKKYALVGQSGKGKSTILKLLSGKLTEYTGTIYYDSIDYKEINTASLRDQIIDIRQQPYIFNQTLKDNIVMGLPFDEQKFEYAVRESGLGEMMKHLPEGVETVISGDGTSISGGQKQRIAFARGLYSGGKIVLFDEGTSALDQESAEKIERHLVMKKDITLIFVSHHLSDKLKKACDEVITF